MGVGVNGVAVMSGRKNEKYRENHIISRNCGLHMKSFVRSGKKEELYSRV